VEPRRRRDRHAAAAGAAERGLLTRNDGGLRRLLTIPISHFCEKARWALERAGLDYEEERHVQGVHRLASRRAGGAGTLPLLIAEEGVFSESEDILRYADAALEPEERLFPVEQPLRDEVVALCRRLDAGLGPDARRLMYAHMLPRRNELLAVNNLGVPVWEDRLLRVGWPLARRYAARELGIGPTTIRDDDARVRRELDEVAELLADGRLYLCGERFTAADLTFAALAGAAIIPPGYGTPLPQADQLPGPVAAIVRSFREHPAGAYALELYRTHRHLGAGAVADAAR
jgi:glutathione S-transferase